MDSNEKPYKIEWYYNVLGVALASVPVALILAAGWFLGVLVEAIL
jgi:hypothetical protein